MIIIEELHNPSYRLLEWLCARKQEIFDDRLMSDTQIDPEVFSECIVNGNLDLYRWLMESFPVLLPHEQYTSLIYSRGLVEYIKFTEDFLTRITERHWNVTHNSLMRLCQNTRIDPRSRVEDVVNYVQWLIDIGRLSILNANVLISMVQFLLFKSNKLVNLEIIKKLLYVYMFMDDDHDIRNFIKGLLHIVGFYARSVTTPHLEDKLYNLMDEVGIFSSAIGRMEAIYFIQVEVPLSVTTKIRELMIRPSCPSTFDGCMKLVRDVLLVPSSYKNTEDYKNIISYFTFNLNKDGIITEFGTLIFRRLLRMIKELKFLSSERAIGKNCEEFLNDLIFGKNIFPFDVTNANIDSYLVVEMTRLILQHGDQELHKCLNSKIGSRLDYQRAVNSVIRDSLIEEYSDPIPRHRIVEIVKVSQLHVNLRLFFKIKCPITMENRYLGSTILTIIHSRQEKSTEMMQLAEDCLVVILSGYKSHTGFATLLVDYMSYIGQKTIRMILDTYGVPSNQQLQEKIVEYILNNRKDFIKILVEARHNKNRFLELRNVDPHNSCIHNLPRHLIVGTRIYEKRNDNLVHRTISMKKTCSSCNIVFSGIIYHDDEDNFDFYTCENCKTAETQASCNICFTHDEIKILLCGHCYCSECLRRITIPQEPSCAVCKKSVEFSEFSKTVDRVLDNYWSKMEEDVNVMEAGSKALLEIYGSQVFDETSADDESD